ncbi:hypothetical protein B0H63DRAFT_518786 [Podospora didyma]|uniref:Ankyrin repeat protein n=1 Tax=Podospora didyma TaxID=330526 RepID=A0AAE0NY48_9PEZI|nr:hypothetical protein B0H63DRAFT_518786 [Podospora didyma]
MKRVNAADPPKPYDDFDMMGGTRTGGLIAIMLGQLRMNIDECTSGYLELVAAAFQLKRSKANFVGKVKDKLMVEGAYRSDCLADAIRKVAKSLTATKRRRWRALISPAELSIGTGVPNVQDFGDDLKEILHTLKAISTETETTHKRFDRYANLLDLAGRYFRFNVQTVLQGVRLNGHEKLATITATTELYLDDPTVRKQAERFAESTAPQSRHHTSQELEQYFNWLPGSDERKPYNEARQLRTAHNTGPGSGKTALSSAIIDEVEAQALGLTREYSQKNGQLRVPTAFTNLYSHYYPSKEPKVKDLYNAPLVEEINMDIGNHLLQTMNRAPYKSWSQSLKDRVIEHITEYADGDFRWADLQIKDLAGKHRAKDVDRCLLRLPRTLEETWLSFAKRSLTLAEIAEVAAFEVESTNDDAPSALQYKVSFRPDNRFPTLSSIHQLLSGLVVVHGIDDESWDGSSDERSWRNAIVSFSHFSVQEYPVGNTTCLPQFKLQRLDCERFILKSCLVYMEHYDFEYLPVHVSAGRFALLPYACSKVWSHAHAVKVESCSNSSIISTISTMFSQALAKGGRAFRLNECLHFPAAVGDEALSRIFLDAGAGVEVSAGYSTTPFHAAAAGSEHFRGLLEMSEQIDLGTSWFGKRDYIMDMLHRLPEAPSSPDIVRLLLEVSDNCDKKDWRGKTPLSCAASEGALAVTQVLLDTAKVDINSSDIQGWTPIFWGAAMDRTKVVELLLQHEDCNPRKIDRWNDGVLILAIRNGHIDVFQLLLAQPQMPVNQRGGHGRTPLLWPASIGCTSIAESLLSRADVLAELEAADGLVQEIMHLAASGGHVAIMKLLIQHGAGQQANLQDKCGCSVLAGAARGGHESAAQFLLERHGLGIDASLKDLWGWTPLT